MATAPVKQSEASDRKDGVVVWKIDALAAATNSDPIDTRGAACVWAVSAAALSFRMYDTVLNDGTSYAIATGEDCVSGGAATVGHLNNPPPSTVVRNGGGGAEDILIVVIYHRRRVRRGVRG